MNLQKLSSFLKSGRANENLRKVDSIKMWVQLTLNHDIHSQYKVKILDLNPCFEIYWATW